MKTDKKFMRISGFLVFLIIMVFLPISAKGITTGYYTKDIPFKQKGNNYNVVAHGNTQDYVTVYIDSYYGRVKISYLKLHWHVGAGVISLQSYLYWIKNYITLKAGSQSVTLTFTEWEGRDPSPYDYSGIRYITSSSYIYILGRISVTIETKIKYRAWCIFYWATRYESVVTTLYFP